MQGEIPNLRVGPNPQGLGVKLSVRDGPTTVICDGRRAQTRLLLVRSIHGGNHDSLIKEYVHHFDDAISRPWPATKDDFLKMVKAAGVEISYDQQAAAELDEKMARTQARYSRTFPVDRDDGTTEWVHVPGTVDPNLKTKSAEILRYLGWGDSTELFDFSFDNACEILTKEDALLALFTGAGKTRLALACADGFAYRDGIDSPTIIVAQKRHLRAWREELGGVKGKAPCNLLVSRYGRGCYEELIEKDDSLQFNQPYILVSFERLIRLDGDQLKQLQEVAKQSTILLDEAYTIANKNAQRTQALRKLQGRHHLALSATPFRGFVTSLLSVLQWVFRGGSTALPEYPVDRAGSERRFAGHFLSRAKSDDGGSKIIPFIRNLNQLQDLLAPLMIRRLRAEPEVCAILGDVLLDEHYIEVDLNPAHQKMYLTVLKRFTDWYAREVEKRRKDGKSASIPQQEVLIKLGYLVRGVSQPWRMADHSDDEFDFPAYARIPTSLHEKAMEIAEAQIAEDNAVLIFGKMTDQLDVMAEVMRERGYVVGVIHGGISQDQREVEISRLQSGETQVLFGSFDTAAEGLNLASASVVICVEWDWVPSVMKQAVGRIMRGIQEKPPIAYYLTARGTVQEYQRQNCTLKTDASSAALDHTKQKATHNDIPDVNVYCRSLVGNTEADPDQAQRRIFEIDLEGQVA